MFDQRVEVSKTDCQGDQLQVVYQLNTGIITPFQFERQHPVESVDHLLLGDGVIGGICQSWIKDSRHFGVVSQPAGILLPDIVHHSLISLVLPYPTGAAIKDCYCPNSLTR